MRGRTGEEEVTNKKEARQHPVIGGSLQPASTCAARPEETFGSELGWRCRSVWETVLKHDVSALRVSGTAGADSALAAL